MITVFKKAPRRQSAGDGSVTPKVSSIFIFLMNDSPWDYSEVD
jgi:hypothetical protein